MLEIRKRIIVTLSHDIRGPLNAISGSAELAMNTRDRKRRNAYLENILDASRHIMRLANSLLDLSRLNESKETLNEVPFRLGGLLDRIVEEYTHTANSKGLLLSDERSDTDVTVRGDADRIEQIADNLLSNAVKFTEAGKIILETCYGNGFLRLRVSDARPPGGSSPPSSVPRRRPTRKGSDSDCPSHRGWCVCWAVRSAWRAVRGRAARSRSRCRWRKRTRLWKSRPPRPARAVVFPNVSSWWTTTPCN